MLSILTNNAAAGAVRALNQATADVAVHQERVATGRRVNAPRTTAPIMSSPSNCAATPIRAG